MANKSNEPASRYGIVKVTAFWGIIISGIAGLFTLILRILAVCGISSGALGRVASVLNLIANLALLISVFLAAYAHSKSQGKTLRTLFWVFSVLAFLSILGFNIMGMI